MLCHKCVEPVRHDTPAELREVVLLATPALHMVVSAPGATEGETVYLRRWLWLAFGGQDRLVHGLLPHDAISKRRGGNKMVTCRSYMAARAISTAWNWTMLPTHGR